MAQRGLLPVIKVRLGGRLAKALVDTGCSTAVVRADLVDYAEGTCYMTAFDGRVVKCHGTSQVELEVEGMPLKVKAVVMDKIVNDIDIVMGMDVINELGGVYISGRMVKFGDGHCLAAAGHTWSDEGRTVDEESCQIVDKDFTATFNGKYWIVEWRWKEDRAPVLKNKVSMYENRMTGNKKVEFDKEIERWIDEGILLPWEGEVERGILPFIAVEQPTKNKIRPVLDYRELNEFVECHTGDDVIDVCSEVLRDWRRTEGQTAIVDLRSAYLQIRVKKELWKYQLVKYKNRTYCLTRLGFGLSSAPRIMSRILKTVLGRSEKIRNATSSYIDDILVNESCVSASELTEYLAQFGLVAKPAEPLDGGAALGLKLRRDVTGELVFYRGNDVPAVKGNLTRRELFSACGKLVGHYPIAGWLRIACSYVKRRAEGARWDDSVGESALKILEGIIKRVQREDPVRGKWMVPKKNSGVVWCDASSLAIGALLEIGGEVVEDAAWLRKKSDYNHINVAELEAVLKGVNLALKWNLRDIHIMTDSVTVYGWMNAKLTEERRVQTKGAAEMIVKRRLGILRNLIDEFDLKISITRVPSEKNKADMLTRVARDWLKTEDYPNDAIVCAGAVDLVEVHNMHHVGVERTLFLARKLDPTVTRQSVREVVSRCQRCQSIDPAPVVHERGEIGVKENWKRLAIDVTHYRQALFLTMVDCGPGRFAIWKKLRRESAECITEIMDEVFLERGPVMELLMDNAMAFRSEVMKRFLNKWKVRSYFRAAYRPSGNGIVERHHRTIKAMAERGGIAPGEAVFWYNMSPREGQCEESVPQRSLFKYDWRHPAADVPISQAEQDETVRMGEEVWVKPPEARCTTQWCRGVVTGVKSRNNVEVDAIPRHILDIRRVVSTSEESEEEGEQEAGHEVEEAQRYPQRERRPPVWMKDYVEMGD